MGKIICPYCKRKVSEGGGYIDHLWEKHQYKYSHGGEIDNAAMNFVMEGSTSSVATDKLLRKFPNLGLADAVHAVTVAEEKLGRGPLRDKRDFRYKSNSGQGGWFRNSKAHAIAAKKGHRRKRGRKKR